ncbi:MAG TPA: hypothetical protein VFB43_00960 [Terracidiphilus sp.]|nr:hypothetical protein [Terracidiphilus sp.]
MKRSNLFQTSLIAIEEPAKLAGKTAGLSDTERLAGQYDRVKSLMVDGLWHTLPELSKELKRRFGQLYSETSISARIRDMRKRGWGIECQRTKKNSGLFQYRAAKHPLTWTDVLEGEKALDAAYQNSGATA